VNSQQPRPSGPNEALRTAIKEAGCTYDTLARTVVRVAAENGEHARTNRSAVAHWLRGVRPSDRTAGYLAEALSRLTGRPVTVAELGYEADVGNGGVMTPFTPDAVGALTDLGAADLKRRLDRRSVLFSAAMLPLSLAWLNDADARGRRAREHGGTVGQAEIQTVQTLTEAYYAADENLGGGHGRTAVIQYLVTDVATFCTSRFRNDTDRRDMFSAAAELAYLAGWQCHDLGQEGLAQHYYAKSLQLATEADPHGQAAWTLRIMAHQALDLRTPAHSVALATRAVELAAGRVDPATEALFAITAARAHAADRNTRAATAAVHAAEDSIARDESNEADMPHWATLTGPARATVASHVAKTFTALGDHARAEQRYLAAAKARNPERFRRIHALNLAQAAEAQAGQGHADHACETWGTALGYMAGVDSDRIKQAVTGMRRTLVTFRRRGVPQAAGLDQQGAALLAQMTS